MNELELYQKVQELEQKYSWVPEGFGPLQIAYFWLRVNRTNSCWLWTGAKNSSGYGQLSVGMAHRISYEMFHGKIPSGMDVMHLCNNPACVNPAHLQIGTHQINVQDMYRQKRYSQKGKSSKYIGVSYRKSTGKWRAMLRRDSLGDFDSEEVAALAYDKAAREIYGEMAPQNFSIIQEEYEQDKKGY